MQKRYGFIYNGIVKFNGKEVQERLYGGRKVHYRVDVKENPSTADPFKIDKYVYDSNAAKFPAYSFINMHIKDWKKRKNCNLDDLQHLICDAYEDIQELEIYSDLSSDEVRAVCEYANYTRDLARECVYIANEYLNENEKKCLSKNVSESIPFMCIPNGLFFEQEKAKEILDRIKTSIDNLDKEVTNALIEYESYMTKNNNDGKGGK